MSVKTPTVKCFLKELLAGILVLFFFLVKTFFALKSVINVIPRKCVKEHRITALELWLLRVQIKLEINQELLPVLILHSFSRYNYIIINFFN